ncbi:MAG: DUF5777 family beta-barrel protein [bacterium]
MNLLIALLVAFPGTRIANLPTGRLLEPGIWQVGVSHRFLSAADNEQLKGNPLNFVTNASVRVFLDRGITRRLSVGIAGGNASHDLGLHAGWAPTRWLTASAGAWTDLVERGPTSTRAWFAAGLPLTLARRVHLLLQPRAGTNFDELVVSLGAGAQLSLPAGLSLGLETEPVLLGESDKLAWNLALDKQLGWHNFTFVAGNNWHQAAPDWFTRANRDITRGYFRVGFNILRKL